MRTPKAITPVTPSAVAAGATVFAGPFRTNIGSDAAPIPPEAWNDIVALGRMAEPDELKGVALLLAHLENALPQSDLLIVGEELRNARAAIDALTGRASTEHMLDRLFAGFCIGK